MLSSVRTFKCSFCGKTGRKQIRHGQNVAFCSKECRKEYTRKYSNNYIYVKAPPGHPCADARGNILEHRLVMELNIGRFLEPNEIVHHKDGIKSHNDYDNLVLFSSPADHIINGHPEIKNNKPPISRHRGKSRIATCPQCGKGFLLYAHRDDGTTRCCSPQCARLYRDRDKHIEVECKVCGKKFMRIPSRITNEVACSIECRNKLRSYGTVSLTCAMCNKPFERLARKVPGWKLGKPYYCSKTCSSKAGHLARKLAAQ